MGSWVVLGPAKLIALIHCCWRVSLSQVVLFTRNCLLQEELWCIIHVLPELYEVPLGSRMQVRKASQSGESWVTEGRDSSTEFQVTKRTRDG